MPVRKIRIGRNEIQKYFKRVLSKKTNKPLPEGKIVTKLKLKKKPTRRLPVPGKKIERKLTEKQKKMIAIRKGIERRIRGSQLSKEEIKKYAVIVNDLTKKIKKKKKIYSQRPKRKPPLIPKREFMQQELKKIETDIIRIRKEIERLTKESPRDKKIREEVQKSILKRKKKRIKRKSKKSRRKNNIRRLKLSPSQKVYFKMMKLTGKDIADVIDMGVTKKLKRARKK
ncbi:hypothetical protein ACFL2K_01605 [Candidatus Margulisiibacteriota bacterium]